jgi:threonine dehydratase
MLGVELHLKAELFQKTGSFKPRGLLHKLKKLPPDARERGLISISAGNAAAALAWGASRLGAHATVVMPAGAATSKVEATRAYGGEVVPTEGDLLATCRALEAERGLTFVHPFDDLDVMAGHGTVGLEILEDLPDAGLVVVPVGGGGLIGGMAAAIKAVHPATRVVGVEPVGAPAMTRSLAAGEPIHLDRLDTIADGLAAPFAGEHTLAHVQAFVDDVVTVEDEAIIEALRLLLTRTTLLAEPSGAAALAALTAGAVELPTGKAVVCVVSGGNVDVELLREVL